MRARLLRTLGPLALILLLAAPLWAQDPPADPTDERNLVQAARAMRSTGKVQLNFKDLELAKFIRFMSELLGENLVVDPGLKGNVSVVSPRAISFKEARQVMLSILEMNSLTLQNMGGYSKVLPASAGPSQDFSVRKSPRGPGPGEQVVTQVVPLDYVKAGYVVEPVKAAVQGIGIQPLQSQMGVLLTGKATLVQRAVSLIQALDASDSIRAAKVFSLQYASPKLLEGQFNALSKDPGAKVTGILAVADEPSKKLILVGTRQALREAQRIIQALDVPVQSTNFRVYKLQNSDAKKVAEQLSQILAVAAKMQPDAKGTMPTTVVPDLPTNSLVFSAPPEQYAAIERVLEQLDIQPKQVLLRGLVAEVNLTKLDQAGVDWAAWGGGLTGDGVFAGQVEMGNSTIPPMFLEWFRDLTKHDTVTYDRFGNAITTTVYDSKALVYGYVKLLNRFDAINVLSMPRIMCTDNLESSLQVGQVIPQLKGKLSEVNNPSAVQSSYEYKDTGLILKVTPHIRSGNLVALEIEQRIEEVVTASTVDTPTTTKREIKTNVLVENGQTIILGGIIKEAEKSMKSRVPGLSYIPLLGNLFTSTVKQREKVDLMIFLTPYILENPRQAVDVSVQISSGDQVPSAAEAETTLRLDKLFKDAVRKQ